MRYRKFPDGGPGVETRRPLLLNRAGQEKESRLSLQRFVQFTSSQPDETLRVRRYRVRYKPRL